MRTVEFDVGALIGCFKDCVVAAPRAGLDYVVFCSDCGSTAGELGHWRIPD